ncbi:MAG: replication-relaxation family protein [Nitrososphaera sp.]
MSKAQERILRVTRFYRFLTAYDFLKLLYSPGSLTYVRARLKKLAANQYLYRFKLPSNGQARIYTLGAKGRNYLAKEMGLTADWYFRPHKLKYLSHSQADHNRSLTRFLIAAQAWARKQSNYRIAHIRICYELAQSAPLIQSTTQGITEKTRVIPDGWILVEKLTNGAHDRFIPVWIELDRGTQHSEKFTKSLRARIAFIQSGAYTDLFHTKAVLIAYITTGQTPEYRETRRKALCTWINQTLHELGKPSWASIFRICSTTLEDIYQTPFFDAPIWYRPDSDTPVPLFTP